VRNLLEGVESRRLLQQRSAVVADASVTALHGAAAHEVEAINLLMRAVEYRDNHSGMHVIRIGQYAALLARGLGKSLEEQRLLMLASPMHDIGKVAVRDGVLLKSGPLTPAEWDQVRGHPAAGHDILKTASSPVIRLGAEIALGHHERWNGGGYPNGLAGAAIPLSARIVAVADAFDAMLSDRPYRRALRHEKAFEELRTHAGTFYDPVIAGVAEAHQAEMLGVASTFTDAAAVS
jgi:putative two-component system response regulator